MTGAEIPRIYPGGELELFRDAKLWKRYLATQLTHALVGEVLEVGAGIGGMTRVLRGAGQARWVALEPDPDLAACIRADAEAGRFGRSVEVQVGTLSDLADDARFDALLYTDVLEHIENDAEELSRAAARLRPGGSLIIVAPAHAWLYSEFDRAIGHHRRYTAETLRALRPPGVELRRIRYLDSAGMLASMANRWLLHRELPTPRQIATWNRLLVPVSRWLDPLLGYRVGKTVLAIWSAPRLDDHQSPNGAKLTDFSIKIIQGTDANCGAVDSNPALVPNLPSGIGEVPSATAILHPPDPLPAPG